jgi:hypothetical protein
MFSAVEEEGPGIVRMKLISAFGRCVRSLRRSKPRGMVDDVYVCSESLCNCLALHLGTVSTHVRSQVGNDGECSGVRSCESGKHPEVTLASELTTRQRAVTPLSFTHLVQPHLDTLYFLLSEEFALEPEHEHMENKCMTSHQDCSRSSPEVTKLPSLSRAKQVGRK